MHAGWIPSLHAGWPVARAWRRPYGTVQARVIVLAPPGLAEVSDDDVLRTAIKLCKRARALVLASLLVSAAAL
jgi:hypothetical protein